MLWIRRFGDCGRVIIIVRHWYIQRTDRATVLSTAVIGTFNADRATVLSKAVIGTFNADRAHILSKAVLTVGITSRDLQMLQVQQKHV